MKKSISQISENKNYICKKKHKMEEKKKMSDIDIKTKILGFAMLPIALVLWMVDRLIHVMMPHAAHPTFKAYLMKSGNIKYTLVRIIVFSIPVITYKLLF